MTCTHYLNIKLIFSVCTEKLGYSQTQSIVLIGSLTQRMGESPVTFFTAYAKKWSENRAPVVIINEMVITITVFLDITYLFKTHQRLDAVSVFRWNILSWEQSIQRVPIPGHQHQHKTGYINQAKHKPICEITTNIKNIKKKTLHTRPSTYAQALFQGYCS